MKTYTMSRCTLCGLSHSSNGLAAASHKKMHVKQGLLTVTNGRYEMTRAGRAQYGEATSQMHSLRVVLLATQLTLQRTEHEGWLEAYKAYSAAGTAYNDYLYTPSAVSL